MKKISDLVAKLFSRRKPEEVLDDGQAVKNRLKRLNGRKSAVLPALSVDGNHEVATEGLLNRLDDLEPGELPIERKPMASDKLQALRRLETQNRIVAFEGNPAEDLAEVSRYRADDDELSQLPHIHQASQGEELSDALLLTEEEGDDAFIILGAESNESAIWRESALAANASQASPEVEEISLVNATAAPVESEGIVVIQPQDTPLVAEVSSDVAQEMQSPAVPDIPPYTLNIQHNQVGFFDAANLLNLRINHELARNQEKSRRHQIENGPNELRKTLESKRPRKGSVSQHSLPALPENPSTPKKRSELETTLQLNRLELFGEKLDDKAIGEAKNDASAVKPEAKKEEQLPGRFDKYLLAENIQNVPKKGKDALFVNQWDCNPELSLTSDGVLKKSADQQSQNEMGVEKSGVEEIFVEFDTTANLPDRANPFEKFSESSLKLLAGNPRTPARILSWLASHFNHEIRVLVARNRSALPETIWLLAKDYDESVRLAIAEHLESDRAVLKSLCDDASPLVAWRAKNTLYLLKSGARTHNNLEPLPSEPLHSNKGPNPFRSLTNPSQSGASEPDETDEEMAFLKVIAQKSSTPPRRLAELAKHPNKEIRAMVAENANSPLETLWFLSRDQVADVKLKLTENYNCPIEIIEALQDDKDSYVSWQARNVLSKLMGEFYPGLDLPEEPTNPRLLHSR